MRIRVIKFKSLTAVLLASLVLSALQFPFLSVTAHADTSQSGLIQAQGVGDPSWPAKCPDVIDTQNTDQPKILGFNFDGTNETFIRLADGTGTATTVPGNLVGCYADFTSLATSGANGYHVGTISRDATGYYWLNAQGAKWGLTLSGSTLITDKRNPYYSNGHTFTFLTNVPKSIMNPNLIYHSGLGIAASSVITGTPGYYVQAPVATPIPDTFSSGFGWYSSIFPLFETPVKGSSLGLSSTWIVPNIPGRTAATAQNLCTTSTNGFIKSLASNPAYGTYGYYLYQTIEGSLGWWLYEKYPSVYPKYQANVTQNCYSSQLATPGWGFFDGAPTARDSTGLIQLSNQILLPPDGMTFQPDPTQPQLGVSWLSLPLPNFDHQYANAAGNNSWTLFMKTANFSGPVEFVAPQFWADGSLTNPVQKGLTLDTTSGNTGQLAAEWGEIPYYEEKGADGKIYSKLPPLQLPSDANGHLVMSRDFTAYSAAALSNQVASALQNNTALPVTLNSSGVDPVALGGQSSPVYQNGDAIPYLSQLLSASPFNSGSAYGFTVPNPNSVNKVEQYYVSEGGGRTPVPESKAPTDLVSATFDFDGPSSFVYQSPDWWNASVAASTTYSVQLNDGSSVDYKWYKFVDQPALQRFELNDVEKNNLQAAVEKIQREWPNSQLIKQPSGGTLASFDSGLVVTPPAGLEIGYVPIVIKQYFGAPTSTATPTPSPQATPSPTPSPTTTLISAPIPIPAPSSTPAQAPKAMKTPSPKTIACIKGKTTKHFSGISPKCPAGYTLKK